MTNSRKKNPISRLVRSRDTIASSLTKTSEALRAQAEKLRGLSIDETASREKVNGGVMLLLLIVRMYSRPPYPGCRVDYLPGWMWRPASDIASLLSKAIKDGLVEYTDDTCKFVRLTCSTAGYSGEWYYETMDAKRRDGKAGVRR